jgi:hypothetical protein
MAFVFVLKKMNNGNRNARTGNPVSEANENGNAPETRYLRQTKTEMSRKPGF